MKSICVVLKKNRNAFHDGNYLPVVQAFCLSGYAFDENDPNVVNYLNEKFDFYHAAPNGTLTQMTSPYQNADEIYLDKRT